MISPLLTFSQASLIWQADTGGVALATDDLNNVYTVRWDYNPAGDIYLKKHDVNGNFQWEVRYDNTDNTRHEVATWVATDNAQNILVSGTIRSGYASPVNAASVLMKFDPSGNLLWRVVYETSFDGSSTKKCLIDADNNIYVLGLGSGPAGMVTKVKKFNSSGVALWSYFDNAGIGAPLNFKLTPDNHLLLIGRGTVGSINGYAKIDLNGNNIWSLGGIYSLTVGDAAGDAFGNTYIVNGEYVFGATGCVVQKLSPTGTNLWSQNNSIGGTKVEVGTDNQPVIGGFPAGGGFGLAMVKLNTSGAVIWTNADADGAGYNLLLHAMMRMDAANNIYFGAGTLFEMAVCRVNADGSIGYVATCSGGYTNVFDFSNDYSSLFVVGGTIARFDQDPIFVCTAPTGLLVNNITTTKARLNWTLEPGAVQYEVWYKKTTAINWKKKFVPGINNKLNLKNLTCNTNYVWKIRTICDTVGVDLISDFSADQFFTTAVCREGEFDNNSEQISIYPNPAFDYVSIELPASGAWTITIYDLNGKAMLNNSVNGSIAEISLSALPSGIYMVVAQTKSIQYNEKLVISR